MRGPSVNIDIERLSQKVECIATAPESQSFSHRHINDSKLALAKDSGRRYIMVVARQEWLPDVHIVKAPNTQRVRV